MKQTIIFLLMLLFSCTSPPKEKKAIPAAKVENQVKETDLTKVILTSDAVKRLGLQTAPALSKNIHAAQIFSGEVTNVPGTAVTITAPVTGTLLPPNGSMPHAGQQVAKGQVLFRLVILPSEKDMLSAKQDAQQKRVQVDVSRKKYERLSELYADGASSQRAMQEAEAELAANQAALQVAEARVALLSSKSLSNLTDKISTLSVKSSVSGVIQRMYVSSSQLVTAATPVYDIASLGTVWVRVPVYAGDIEQVNRTGNASVNPLSDFEKGTGSFPARAVQGPQTADASSSTIYLYYEVANNNGRLLPGQRISVSLPLKDIKSALTVPFSSIVYDIQGGTWVYEQTDSLTFIRRRVELEKIQNNVAVIRRGISENMNIVIVGAAELFGTEFGGGK